MGSLKIIGAPTKEAKKHDPIEDHVQGFLVNFDSQKKFNPFSTTEARLTYENGQRTAYAAGVRDALTWVKTFNEEAKDKDGP